MRVYVLPYTRLILKGGGFVVHVFQTDLNKVQEDFVHGVWEAHKKPVRICDNIKMPHLLRWHYKHSLINAWGSAELKAALWPGFHDAGDIDVAIQYILESFPWLPSTSPAKYEESSEHTSDDEDHQVAADKGPGHAIVSHRLANIISTSS
jgi:hypothetical protein